MFILLLICNLLFMTTPTETPAATFTLIELPYEMSALAPNVSEETLRYHHGKHLQTYVNNVNNLIADTRFASMTLEDIVRQADGPLYNNAAQVLNHNLYFLALAPAAVAKHAPEGPLAAAIKRDFGSFDAMKVQLAKAATSLFGSGWVWLAENRNGNLVILSESNAGNPLRHGLTPLLGIDVWEHAYYLDYQNRRVDHLANLWKIIDWQIVESRM